MANAQEPPRRLVDRLAEDVGAGRRVIEIPGPGAVEHDDVAAVDRPQMIDDLVDEHPVADFEGVLHRGGRDEEGLDREGLDDERQHDRHNDEHGKLCAMKLRRRLPSSPSLPLLALLAPLASAGGSCFVSAPPLGPPGPLPLAAGSPAPAVPGGRCVGLRPSARRCPWPASALPDGSPGPGSWSRGRGSPWGVLKFRHRVGRAPMAATSENHPRSAYPRSPCSLRVCPHPRRIITVSVSSLFRKAGSPLPPRWPRRLPRPSAASSRCQLSSKGRSRVVASGLPLPCSRRPRSCPFAGSRGLLRPGRAKSQRRACADGGGARVRAIAHPQARCRPPR